MDELLEQEKADMSRYMLYKAILLAMSLASLAACANYQKDCADLGWPEGTSENATCVLTKEQNKAAIKAAIMSGYGAQMLRNTQPYAAPVVSTGATCYTPPGQNYVQCR